MTDESLQDEGLYMKSVQLSESKRTNEIRKMTSSSKRRALQRAGAF